MSEEEEEFREFWSTLETINDFHSFMYFSYDSVPEKFRSLYARFKEAYLAFDAEVFLS